MFRFLQSFSSWGLPCPTYHEAVCTSYYYIGNIKKAWHMVSEAITADIHCEISNKMMNMFLLILKNHESLDTECLQQLKETMAALQKYPEYADILALGTLLYWETQNTAFSSAKMDNDALMRKVTQCLQIWTNWYVSVGNEILEKRNDLRTMLSLRFLKNVAELAIVSFQNFTAVTSLSYIRRLAHFVKHKDLVREASQAIITLIPQMGLQCVPEKEDVFMDSMGLGKDSGLLCLTAVASHHLNTGQFHKFMLVRDAVYSQFPSFPLFDLFNKRNESALIVPFAKAVIMRLEAEFLMMPGSRTLEEIKADCKKPMQNALRLVTSSLVQIQSLYNKFGDNFPRMKAARDTLGPWKIVHEYLSTLKLTAEILIYTGLTHKAKQYLKYGLYVAKKFRLVTWGAIFSSRLAERELILDNLEFATSMLQHAHRFLKYRASPLGSSFNHCHGSPTIKFVSDEKLTSCSQMSNLNIGENSFSCQQTNTDIEEDILTNLLEDTRPGRCETDDQKSQDDYSDYLLLTDITSCCSCCQTEIISVCIRLMCLKAEVVWRKERSVCEVSHLLQHSLNVAHQFAKMAPCNSLINFIVESGWKVCPLIRDIASNQRTLAETALKCAEIYFQNLYVKNTEFQTACDHVLPGIDNILSLLDLAETVSKKATGFHLCNVLVASALLTRNHCSYLSILRTLPDEDFSEAESNPASPCLSQIFHTVSMAVNAATREKKTWDNKRALLHKPVEKSEISHLVDTTHHLDPESYVPELGHHTDKPSWFTQLTVNFPSLTASCSVTERITLLQRALQQFQELAHSLLYRQISQSLALCLWEKQMTDIWCGTSETSSSQTKIAAYLMESMHVTFQHMMIDNFCSKLCFADTWKGFSQEAHLDKPAIQEALDVLRFGGDVLENFRDRVASLPEDWTVVQMTIVNFDPKNPSVGQIFITRLNQAQEPITVGLPNHKWEFLKTAQKAYKKAAFDCHLDCLRWKHHRILEILLYAQEVFLCGYKWFLRGQLDCVRQESIRKVLDDAGMRAVSILNQQGICTTQMEFSTLMEIFLGANEADILSVLESMYPQQIAKTLALMCMDVQMEVIRVCGDQWSERRGPVIIILDNECTSFPWEYLPDLICDQVTRIPSFSSLLSLLKWHALMDGSPFNSGVDRTSVATNITWFRDNVRKEYPKMAAEFKQYKGWRTVDNGWSLREFTSCLQNRCLYLYTGHAWPDYSFVQDIDAKALAIILGCSTGSLKKMNIDGDGAPLYFLLAGCPAFVGNLTVSYSHESSSLVSYFSSFWMSESQPISIRELLVKASQATKMSGTCRARLVIYGLPVIMN